VIGLVVFLTSAVACALGATWFGLPCSSLRNAGLKALESVGVATVFFGANLVAGLIVIGVVRAQPGWFVSHYILGDVSLLGLSLLQGIVFTWWSSGPKRAPK
jgi:NO-binding membrane sensor protein with MHYT domain